MSGYNESISVVVPVYGCRAALPELYRRLTETLQTLTSRYEIILVDDCCPQHSWEEIYKLCLQDKRVYGIRLSRNFGQAKAITAGLNASHGDWVVVMDCDLQDRPEGIKDLFAKAQEGYDVVFARRQDRKDGPIVKFFSRAFYRVYDYFTDGYSDNSLANFSISKRIVIDNFCKLNEQNRDYTLFVKWLGFRQTSLDVPADARFAGKSSYNFKKKLRLASDIIVAQSNKPLKFSIFLGSVIALCAFVYVVYLVIRTLVVGGTPPGWASTIGSIYLMGGILLAAIGIVGVYIGNIFDEVKNRPLYIVQETLNGQNFNQVAPDASVLSSRPLNSLDSVAFQQPGESFYQGEMHC